MLPYGKCGSVIPVPWNNCFLSKFVSYTLFTFRHVSGSSASVAYYHEPSILYQFTEQRIVWSTEWRTVQNISHSFISAVLVFHLWFFTYLLETLRKGGLSWSHSLNRFPFAVIIIIFFSNFDAQRELNAAAFQQTFASFPVTGGKHAWNVRSNYRLWLSWTVLPTFMQTLKCFSRAHTGNRVQSNFFSIPSLSLQPFG